MPRDTFISDQLRALGYTRVPGSARHWLTPGGQEVSRRQAETAAIQSQYSGIRSREEYYSFRQSEQYAPVSVSQITGIYETEPGVYTAAGTGDWRHEAHMATEDFRPFYELINDPMGLGDYDEADFQETVARWYEMPWGDRYDPPDTLNAVNWARDQWGWVFDWDTHTFYYPEV